MGKTRKNTALDTNTVLFFESALDSIQSAVMKRDMALVLSLHRAEQTGKILMVAARAVIVAGLIATAVMLITGVISELPAAALALTGLFATPTLEHVANEFSKERSSKLAQVKTINQIADIYAQYGAGETVAKKLSGYIALLTHQSVQVGNIMPYTLRLDTSNEANYIVRMFTRSAATD